MSEQELEFVGDFDPENEQEEDDQNIRYVFDPDTEQDEQILYDPKRKRRKTKTRWRTRTVTRARRAYRRTKKKAKPAIMGLFGWHTALAIPVAIFSFIISMQQDTMAWFAEKDPTHITNAFSIHELLKTLGGGWGRPKDLVAYARNVLSSPLSLGGLGLMLYSILPIRRLPLKRIALIVGGALIVGSFLGSALHASGENADNPHYSGSGISERQAYSHVLQNDPFNSTYGR